MLPYNSNHCGVLCQGKFQTGFHQTACPSSKRRAFNLPQDPPRSLPDPVQRLHRCLFLAVVELDVVTGGGVGVEVDGFTDHKGDSLGFSLQDRLRSLFHALLVVQYFMRLFMDQDSELHCLKKSLLDFNATAM